MSCTFIDNPQIKVYSEKPKNNINVLQQICILTDKCSYQLLCLYEVGLKLSIYNMIFHTQVFGLLKINTFRIIYEEEKKQILRRQMQYINQYLYWDNFKHHLKSIQVAPPPQRNILNTPFSSNDSLTYIRFTYHNI